MSQEAVAIGRTFAAMKDYHLDGNKEMVALGTMNIVGSMTSCYIATGMLDNIGLNAISLKKRTSMSKLHLISQNPSRPDRWFRTFGRELHGWMQHGCLQHRNVLCRFSNNGIDHPTFQVHPERHSGFHHHISCGRIIRLPGDDSHMEDR